MSGLADRLTGRPHPKTETATEQQRQPRRAEAESKRDRPLLWSRAMQEARGRALLLARRAFPWRYY